MHGDVLGVVVGNVSSHGTGAGPADVRDAGPVSTLATGTGNVGEILTAQPDALGETHELHFVTLAMATDRIRRSAGAVGTAARGRQELSAARRSQRDVAGQHEPAAGSGRGDAGAALAARTLHPRRLLLLLTDGVLEAESLTRQRFGVDRALEVIQAEA